MLTCISSQERAQEACAWISVDSACVFFHYDQTVYAYSITVIHLSHESNYVLGPMSLLTDLQVSGWSWGCQLRLPHSTQTILGIGCPWARNSTLVQLTAYGGGRVGYTSPGHSILWNDLEQWFQAQAAK